MVLCGERVCTHFDFPFHTATVVSTVNDIV
jgi:kynurenine formamidase